MRRLPLTLLVVAASACAALAAPPPRPLTGSALLNAPEAAGDQVVVYAEPGVQRVALLPLERLPRLASDGEVTVLAALARKGRWVKVAYDDAERQGWIAAPPSWEYLPWRRALAGREARLLPAMKKGNYALKDQPADSGAECGTLAKNQQVRILSVEEDWALCETPAGWFRWRDAEGRLTISLDGSDRPEKR